jgi:ATP-dependent RNA helicase RhlE
MVAADGFDFSKPYESVAPAPAALGPDHPAEPPKRPQRPVAFLLGGLGRK